MALIYFFFVIKCEPLIGEILMDIESPVAKQAKKCDFVSFKTFCWRKFFITVKGIFKSTF